MICCRKIHDEYNIFEGINKNPMFIIIWFACTGGQVLITMFGSLVFQVNAKGLDGPQWGIAFLVGTSSFLINIILKSVPDWLTPKIGDDRVFNARYPKWATKLEFDEEAVDDEK